MSKKNYTMRILALIPARGGSKRLPGKNIRVLGNKPLIVWSIDVIKGIPEICDVLVSTDDPEIASIARTADALVPWLRPPELATDIASSVDVCLHALKWYESERGRVDGLLLLQPTSPFRKRATIQRGIELFYNRGRFSVVGVSPTKSHPMWCFKIEEEKIRPFLEEGLELRSQDLPPAYVVNGAFYLVTPKNLRKYRELFTENTIPLIIDSSSECIDIDTEWDWQIAESIVNLNLYTKEDNPRGIFKNFLQDG